MVTVPVLSSTTVSTRRVDSRTSGPRIRMPSCAPRPVPTSSAVGVASPSAHGQAMISTATALVNAASAGEPAISQPASVPSAMTEDDGDEDGRRRGRPAAGPAALPDCASATSRAICASAVSAPTRVAWTTRRPPTLTVAPVTASPGAASTGRLSPVSSERSTADVPSRRRRRSRSARRAGRRTGRRPRAGQRHAALARRPAGRDVVRAELSRARRAAPARAWPASSRYRPARRNTSRPARPRGSVSPDAGARPARPATRPSAVGVRRA